MATLVGCDIHGSFFKIDTSNGIGVAIGSTGFIGTNSLARDGSGTLYSESNGLIRIDSNTGKGTLVVKLQPPRDVRALAFSPTGVLYAIHNGADLGGISAPDDLITIDVTNGATTIIGNTGRSGLQGLAFASNGTLYGWDIAYGLVTINLASGAATLVNPAVKPGSVADLQSIAFAPNGTLYGAREKLYTVALSNGATTSVGCGGYTDIRGIEFLKEKDKWEIVRTPSTLRLTWLWMILIGYILVTPIGPLCIVCGDPFSGLGIRILGAITLGLGAFGVWRGLSPGQR